MKNYFLIILLVVLFPAMSASTGLKFDSGSQFPFWSQLSQFEEQSLSKITAAKRGNTDALLRLYLIASGDIRQLKEFSKIKYRLNKFYREVGTDIANEKNDWEKGYQLNRAMHNYFFRENDQSSTLNYDADQSQMSEIFRSAKYNCISSTMLYIYLAKKLHLDVQAVILPTHTFVQLNLGNGKKIEVETTSANGFDWIHDRKFYKLQSSKWFSKRSLKPSTYEDYKNRRIVSAVELAAVDMNTQHTFLQRMSRENKIRLLEMSVLIAPTESDNLLSLLYGYNNEFIRFNKQNDFKSVKPLYNKTYQWMSALWMNQPVDRVKILKAFRWYFSQAAYTFMKTGELSKAETIFLQHYDDVKKHTQDEPGIMNNYRAIFHGLLKKYLLKNQIKQADRLISKVNVKGFENGRWQKIVMWYYGKQLEKKWQVKNWLAVINLYDHFKHQKLNIADSKQFEQNVTAAFQNQSLTFERKGNWRGAAEVLLQCIEKIPLASNCMKNLERLRHQHQVF